MTRRRSLHAARPLALPMRLALTIAFVAATTVAATAGAQAARQADLIVFTDGAGFASEIYVRSSDGIRRRLTRNRVAESLPAWSPDGRRIAFVRDGDIWVMDADGTDARRLAANDSSAADLYPAWSPDGKRIAFASNRGDREAELYVMNADGSNPRRLTRTARWIEDTQPRFSPDGRYIVFAANRPSFFNYEIYRIRASDGGGLTRLTFWGSGQDGAPGDDLGPTYSPDGKTIAFTSDRSGGSALWTMRADGRNLREVARHPGGHVVLPRFSPDGRRLVYTVTSDEPGKPVESRVWIVQLDVGARTDLGPGREPDWSAPRSSAADRSITQSSIGGARLGLSRQAYVRTFGTPRVDLLEGGITALVFKRLGLAVYLRGNVGVAINTFGRTFRTSEGIGPCSPFRALMAAYDGQLQKLPTSGPVSLYRLGNLVFRVDRSRQRVGAVTLGKGTLAGLIAGNSIDCGAK